MIKYFVYSFLLTIENNLLTIYIIETFQGNLNPLSKGYYCTIRSLYVNAATNCTISQVEVPYEKS